MTTKKNNARTSEILEKGKAFVEKCQKNFGKGIIIGLTAFSLSGILTSCESSVEELKNNPTYTKKLTENSSVRKQIQKCQDLGENIGAKLTKAYCDNTLQSSVYTRCFSSGALSAGYKLEPVTVDDKKVDISFIDDCKLSVMVTDADKKITGNLRFFHEDFVGDQVDIVIYINDVLFTKETINLSDTYVQFATPKTGDYLDYITTYGEKAKDKAFMALDKEYETRDRQVKIEKQKQDSLQNIKIQESLDQQKLLDQEIKGSKK